jgi:hypothetical protein
MCHNLSKTLQVEYPETEEGSRPRHRFMSNQMLHEPLVPFHVSHFMSHIFNPAGGVPRYRGGQQAAAPLHVRVLGQQAAPRPTVQP